MTDNGDESTEQYVPVRMLNEYVYCPRLFYLEWVENEFRDSKDTVEGRIVHRNVDAEAGSLQNDTSKFVDTLSSEIKATSVQMASRTYGISSRMDIVEARGGIFSPVEYKKSKIPEVEEKVWPSDESVSTNLDVPFCSEPASASTFL